MNQSGCQQRDRAMTCASERLDHHMILQASLHEFWDEFSDIISTELQIHHYPHDQN